MSLSTALDILLSDPCKLSDPGYDLASLLDLTLLNEEASATDLISLSEKGAIAAVAALCVLPKHLPLLPQAGLSVVTVINFPEGRTPAKNLLKTIDEAAKNPLQEIDYVFSYENYLQGQTRKAIEDCHQIVKHGHSLGLRVKIILESGAFNNLETLYQTSLDVISSGCDFIKSSTGKIAQGATPAAATAMLAAIRDSGSLCGIKFSGGIRKRQEALRYLNIVHALFDKKIEADWVRFGSSKLLD